MWRVVVRGLRQDRVVGKSRSGGLHDVHEREAGERRLELAVLAEEDDGDADGEDDARCEPVEAHREPSRRGGPQEVRPVVGVDELGEAREEGALQAVRAHEGQAGEGLGEE